MKPHKNPLFQTFCYTLNGLWLSRLAAGLRWLAVKFAPTQYEAYSNPGDVGYLGWLQNAKLGCLAFVKDDKSIQYRW
jgi:hypothetical protein